MTSTRVLVATLLSLLIAPLRADATPSGAIWLSGAEIQSYDYEAASSDNSDFDTTIKHSGAASFRVKSGG
jgi:hypothetical protein